MGDLKEVDFHGAAIARDIQRDPLGAIADTEIRLAELSRDTAQTMAAHEQWRRWERQGLYRQIRKLRRELQLERANQFTDEDVLAALKELGGEVNATAVASRLLRAPSHSAVVRVGLALARLNRGGHVGRILPANSHEAHRWSLRNLGATDGLN